MGLCTVAGQGGIIFGVLCFAVPRPLNALSNAGNRDRCWEVMPSAGRFLMTSRYFLGMHCRLPH